LNDRSSLDRTHFLFVVNRAVSSPEYVASDNEALLRFLEEMMQPEKQSAFLNAPACLHIGFIDATTPGHAFPDTIGGVGLARKIGMDAALVLFSNPEAKNILICLDADCMVPTNYLSAIHTALRQNPAIHAAVVQYEHPVDVAGLSNVEAIVCYELFLRHYTAGLLLAGSPFAFHSIGSAMLCDPETYIKCEGMNKKKAGEDFYFLEKIAKTETVFTINTTKVYPSSRGSWRVPFGTGQRVNRFLAGSENEYLVYAPESFIQLKEFLKLLADRGKTTDEIMHGCMAISPQLHSFLAAQKFPEFRGKAMRLPEKQYFAQCRFWFDGFKTLKLLHHLRDTEFPLQPMFSAVPRLMRLLDDGFGFPGTKDPPALSEQIRLLQLVRDISRRYAADKVD
jgi:hypothetical protein